MTVTNLKIFIYPLRKQEIFTALFELTFIRAVWCGSFICLIVWIGYYDFHKGGDLLTVTYKKSLKGLYKKITL